MKSILFAIKCIKNLNISCNQVFESCLIAYRQVVAEERLIKVLLVNKGRDQNLSLNFLSIHIHECPGYVKTKYLVKNRVKMR